MCLLPCRSCARSPAPARSASRAMKLPSAHIERRCTQQQHQYASIPLSHTSESLPLMPWTHLLHVTASKRVLRRDAHFRHALLRMHWLLFATNTHSALAFSNACSGLLADGHRDARSTDRHTGALTIHMRMPPRSPSHEAACTHNYMRIFTTNIHAGVIHLLRTVVVAQNAQSASAASPSVRMLRQFVQSIFAL